MSLQYFNFCSSTSHLRGKHFTFTSLHSSDSFSHTFEEFINDDVVINQTILQLSQLDHQKLEDVKLLKKEMFSCSFLFSVHSTVWILQHIITSVCVVSFIILTLSNVISLAKSSLCSVSRSNHFLSRMLLSCRTANQITSGGDTLVLVFRCLLFHNRDLS